jgi:hypothetical protein
MGYSIGDAAGGGGTTRASAPARSTAAPALLQLSDVWAQGRAEGRADGRRLAGVAVDRAYVRGREEGISEGKRAERRAAARKRDLRRLRDRPAKPARGR